MTWMLTSTARAVDLVHMQPCNVDINDIAHGLAQINRFNGQASRPYSVAEHSLFVEQLVAARVDSPSVRLAALLHDAHEAYLGDFTSPAKAMLNAASGNALRREEARLQGKVLKHFGISVAYWSSGQLIHWADMTALSTERDVLMPAHPDEWPVTKEYPRSFAKDFEADGQMPWVYWRGAFLERVAHLNSLRQAQMQAMAQAATQ